MPLVLICVSLSWLSVWSKPGQLHMHWKDVLMVSNMTDVAQSPPCSMAAAPFLRISYKSDALHSLATAKGVKTNLWNIWSYGRAKLTRCSEDTAIDLHMSNNCRVIHVARRLMNFSGGRLDETSGRMVNNILLKQQMTVESSQTELI